MLYLCRYRPAIVLKCDSLWQLENNSGQRKAYSETNFSRGKSMSQISVVFSPKISGKVVNREFRCRNFHIFRPWGKSDLIFSFAVQRNMCCLHGSQQFRIILPGWVFFFPVPLWWRLLWTKPYVFTHLFQRTARPDEARITSLRVIPTVTSYYYIFVPNSDILCAKIWRGREGEDNSLLLVPSPGWGSSNDHCDLSGQTDSDWLSLCLIRNNFRRPGVSRRLDA